MLYETIRVNMLYEQMQSQRMKENIMFSGIQKSERDSLYCKLQSLTIFFEFFPFYFSFLDQKSLYKPHSKLHTLHWSLKFAERSQILAYLITCCWRKKQLSGGCFFLLHLYYIGFLPLKKKLVFFYRERARYIKLSRQIHAILI